MNKKGILLVIIVLIIGTIIYIIFNSSKVSEEKIDKYARDYFEKYVSTNESVSTYKITLNDLISANENYDLNEYDKCDKTKTYANVTVDYKTGKPKKVEVELKC